MHVGLLVLLELVYRCAWSLIPECMSDARVCFSVLAESAELEPFWPFSNGLCCQFSLRDLLECPRPKKETCSSPLMGFELLVSVPMCPGISFSCCSWAGRCCLFAYFGSKGWNSLCFCCALGLFFKAKLGREGGPRRPGWPAGTLLAPALQPLGFLAVFSFPF